MLHQAIATMPMASQFRMSSIAVLLIVVEEDEGHNAECYCYFNNGPSIIYGSIKKPGIDHARLLGQLSMALQPACQAIDDHPEGH